VGAILSADAALESAKVKAGAAAHDAMCIGGMDFSVLDFLAVKADPETGKVEAGALVGDMSPAEAKMRPPISKRRPPI
jgi:hypothetical protein